MCIRDRVYPTCRPERRVQWMQPPLPRRRYCGSFPDSWPKRRGVGEVGRGGGGGRKKKRLSEDSESACGCVHGPRGVGELCFVSARSSSTFPRLRRPPGRPDLSRPYSAHARNTFSRAFRDAAVRFRSPHRWCVGGMRTCGVGVGGLMVPEMPEEVGGVCLWDSEAPQRPQLNGVVCLVVCHTTSCTFFCNCWRVRPLFWGISEVTLRQSPSQS